MVRLVEARVVSDHVVWLRFSDGVEGRVDLGQELYGRVFEPLRDLQEFGKLSLDPELGTITWPNGADFAPEFLYAAARRAAANSGLKSAALVALAGSMVYPRGMVRCVPRVYRLPAPSLKPSVRRLGLSYEQSAD